MIAEGNFGVNYFNGVLVACMKISNFSGTFKMISFSLKFQGCIYYTSKQWSFLVAQLVENLPAMQETRVWSLGREDPLEKEMATHSSVLAWRIPWTEEPGGLQTMESQESDMTKQLNHQTVAILLTIILYKYLVYFCFVFQTFPFNVIMSFFQHSGLLILFFKVRETTLQVGGDIEMTASPL